MACVETALIVGGGIAGLSAAIALGRRGVQCDVLETAIEPLGASLGLSGRATDALAELGVYDECYATGRPMGEDSTAGTLHDAAGRVLSAGRERPNWPGARSNVAVYRPVFLQILENAAEAAGAKIRRGLTVQTIDKADGKAAVGLTDGGNRQFDLVIGADGIGSRTRALVFPDAPKPAYVGQLSVRWMVPGPPVQDEGWYHGPLGRVGFYYLPHQQLVYVPAVLPMPEWRRMSDKELASIFTRLLDSYTAPAMLNASC